MRRARSPRFARFVVVPLALAPVGALWLAPACGGGGSDGGGDAAITYADRPHLDAPIHPDARCLVSIDDPELVPASHVAVGTDVTYDSNPPSSGPHYPVWAAYQEFTTPVDPRYWVHDLEHGGIVFLYNCPSGCPDVVAGLRTAAASIPDDPLCASAGAGVRARVVITPDPDLAVPVAAAAWGWTYQAACLDLPSLEDFAHSHYGQGPEVTCGQGQTVF